jgi:nucleotide-binding universal stress UspA family protein
MSRIPVIVAPVDFNQSSTRALMDAATWANELGSELHVLHVVPNPASQSWSVEAVGVDFTAIGEEWVRNAEGALHGLVASVPLPVDRVRTRVQMGRPGEQIVAYAEEHEAGLIVMASGEHGRVARFLLGSVADYVVRAAKCPVLIIPVHAHDAHQSEGDAAPDATPGKAISRTTAASPRSKPTRTGPRHGSCHGDGLLARLGAQSQAAARSAGDARMRAGSRISPTDSRARR